MFCLSLSASNSVSLPHAVCFCNIIIIGADITATLAINETNLNMDLLQHALQEVSVLLEVHCFDVRFLTRKLRFRAEIDANR